MYSVSRYALLLFLKVIWGSFFLRFRSRRKAWCELCSLWADTSCDFFQWYMRKFFNFYATVCEQIRPIIANSATNVGESVPWCIIILNLWWYRHWSTVEGRKEKEKNLILNPWVMQALVHGKALFGIYYEEVVNEILTKKIPESQYISCRWKALFRISLSLSVCTHTHTHTHTHTLASGDTSSHQGEGNSKSPRLISSKSAGLLSWEKGRKPESITNESITYTKVSALNVFTYSVKPIYRGFSRICCLRASRTQP